MTADGPDEHEGIEAERARLLGDFRAWGASEEDVSGADHFLSWLGPVPPFGPTERDVIDFLWEQVPLRFVAEEHVPEAIRVGVGRLLRFLAEQGAAIDPRAVARAEDRETFLRRVRTAEEPDRAWVSEVVDALDATGMEPFFELPDGFAWWPIRWRTEARAHDLLRARMTESVRSGEVDPGQPGWRERSAELQMRWLDTPHPEFDDHPPRTAIAREREERAPDLADLMGAAGAIQELGMFRGPGPIDPGPAVVPGEPSDPDDGLIWSPHDEPFPVVSLPSAEEMADAAAASPFIRWVRALLEVVGNGRPLTKKGHLTLADGRAFCERIGLTELFDPAIGDKVFATRSSGEIEPIELTLRWARVAGLVRVQHGKVLPTKRARSFGRDPLRDWADLFHTFLWKLDWPVRRAGGRRASLDDEAIIELLPRVLEEAYRRDDGTLRLEAVAASLHWAIEQTYDLGWLTDQQRKWLPKHVGWGFWYAVVRPLAVLGAVDAIELGEPLEAVRSFGDRWDVDVDPNDPLVPEADEAERLARFERIQARRAAREGSQELRLTPLGRWAVRRMIAERHGAQPMAAGELAEGSRSVESLMARSAELGLGPEEVGEEIRRFAGRVGAGTAAEGLAELLARGGPSVLAVQRGLEAIGVEEAEPHVRRAAEAEGVAAAGRLQCAAWLRDHGYDVDMPEPTPEALGEATVWTMVAIARADGPPGVHEVMAPFPEGEQLQMVEAMGRVRSPYVAEALEAVAWAALAAKVRKAARKALHRARSRGG